MEGKKGECKYLKEPVCKLGYEIVNDDTCVDCDYFSEEE